MSGFFSMLLQSYIMVARVPRHVALLMGGQPLLFLSLGSESTPLGFVNLPSLTRYHLSQPFWGNMVARAGAGARPIPYSRLDSKNLADAIRLCLTPEAAAAAQQIATKMRAESGVTAAVQSFHRHLPLERMRCHVLPNHAAVWTCVKSKRKIYLSKPAAQILIEKSMIDAKDIRSAYAF